MVRLQQLVRSHSGSILIVFVLAALVAGAFASRVVIDGSVDRLMLRNDPARALDARAKVDFGNDEIIMVGFELPAPYDAADLRKLASISEAIAALDDVERVRDLSSTEDVRGVGDMLDAGPLVELDTVERDLAAIRERARGHRLYDRLLVSEDGRALGMMVYVDSVRSNDETTQRLTGRVLEIATERSGAWRVHFAGYPVTAFEVNRIVKRDLALLTPLCLLAIALVLWVSTRRAAPMGLLIVLVLWVELVALGWLGATGTPINVVISTLPTILVATSGTYLVYAVGLLARVQRRDEPAVALVGVLFRPVLLSASSTAIGFGSLRMIGMESAGDLGVALAIGIVAAACGTLLLIPALVQRYGLRVAEGTGRSLTGMSGVGVRWAERPGRVLVGTALVAGLALPGLTRLELHTDTLQYFHRDNPVRTGAEFFQDRLSSGFLLNVVIRGEGDDRALDPDLLAFADELVGRIEAVPEVDRTISMLDYYALMDAALRPGEPARAHPRSRAEAAQYLLLYEAGGDPEDFERYLDLDRAALSVIVSIRGGSTVYLETARRIEAWAKAAPADVSVDTLGTTFLYSKAMDDLTRGMLSGLAIAAGLIFLVLLAGLGSLRLALLAAVPNALPIVVCGGLLGWLGVPISMSTSLMGCLALGLAVDDTSHVVGHVETNVSLERLYGLVGPPIVLTTFALCAGFAVLLTSAFATVQVLGAAVVATLVLAWAADVLVLPSLLALAGYPRTETGRLIALDEGRRERGGSDWGTDSGLVEEITLS